MFERIGADQTGAEDRYTAADIVAVSMLSVDVPARAAISLLGPDADRVADLLHQIPSDVDLARADPATVAEDSAAWRLWKLLRSYDDIGPTTASKLMARKRPRLIPVQDSVVVATSHHPRGHDFWANLREALGRHVGEGLVLSGWLHEARTTSNVSGSVSELRIFDVLVWMAGKAGHAT